MQTAPPATRGDLFRPLSLLPDPGSLSIRMEEPMRRTKASEVPAYALRHGSPDKVPASPLDVFEVSCPACDATLCVESALLSVSPEFECAGCGHPIALASDGSFRPERRFPRAVELS